MEWIEKVESVKGPAARRAAVELALNDPELVDRRDDFVKSAAQLEVRATLDKVETLKTSAAKRRHLTDALAALRADSAPDELQQAEIEMLQISARRSEGDQFCRHAPAPDLGPLSRDRVQRWKGYGSGPVVVEVTNRVLLWSPGGAACVDSDTPCAISQPPMDLMASLVAGSRYVCLETGVDCV